MRLRVRKGRERLAAGLGALLIAAGAVGAWTVTRPAGTPTSALTTVAATTGTIRQTVSATGTIEPAVQSSLSFTVSGTVDDVPVAVGDTVAKGAALASVGDSDLRSAVQLAQAALDAATEQQTAAETAGSSTTQVASAAAQVAAAEGKLAAAKASLDAATLRSPIAGTVAAVTLHVGDTVGSGSNAASGVSGGASGGGAQGGASSSGGTSAATGEVVVISTRSWVVDASVGSADLASLKKGLQAEITPTGSATKVFGTVSSVGIVASSASGTAVFPVTIAVTGSPAGLYAGGTCTVAIIVKQVADVLTVPTLALHTSGDQTVVQQVKDGKQVSTPVTVGTAYGATTQILSGLSSGDEVVVTVPRPGGPTGTDGTTRSRRSGTGGYPGGQGGGFNRGGYPGGGAGGQGGYPGGGGSR